MVLFVPVCNSLLHPFSTTWHRQEESGTMGVWYTICHWAINRTDPQNSLSTTLDVPLHLSCVVTLLPLPSLVIWLAVDTAELPRTPMLLCGLFFSWPYNWKPTPMTHSKLLTPSVSKCPSPLGLEFLSRERSSVRVHSEAHQNTLEYSKGGVLSQSDG